MKCIEVAHIYANQKWTNSQSKSIEIGKQIMKESSDRMVCLVDNYNASEVEDYIFPKEFNLVVYEKDLVKHFESMNSLILQDRIFKTKIKDKEVYFFKTKGQNIPLWEFKDNQIKIYCVFLCLIWYSCRFCIIQNEWFNQKPKEIINILELKFKPIEEKVILLIKENNLNINLTTIYF